MVRPRRAWRRTAAWGGALAVLLGLAILLVLDAKVAGVTSMFIGLAGLAATILQMVRQSQAAPVDEATRLARAAKQLAKLVAAQWRAEAGLRALRRPAPLRLTWASTTRPVAAPAHTIAGPAFPGRLVRLHLRGHLDEVADKFLALPQRRLVALGEAGAGKTVLALLLTLELLKRRKPGQPVPVLLGLASWDPNAEHLHTWIARRLAEDYPALTHPRYGPDATTKLVTSERILPVLDGLDELPGPLRAAAIGELDRAHADQPLVLTCRTQQYQQAIAAGGGALAAAAVVELQPVTATEAIAFLRTTAAHTPGRWERVAAHLHTVPDGALAAALSTPLMVALARTVYTSPGRDPGELVDLAQAGQAAVELHLLDGFIPAAYTNPPPAPDTPARRLPQPPDPERASRWLTWLATHLQQDRTLDLAWWRLPRLVPRRTVRLLGGLLVGLAVGLLAGLAFGLMIWLDAGTAAMLRVGLAAGIIIGPMGGLQFGLVVREAVPAVSIRVRGRLRDLPSSLTSGLVVMAALLAGLLAGFGYGRVFGVGVGLLVGLLVGLAGWLLGGLRAWIQSPVDDAMAVTPWSVLRSDRTAAIVAGLGFWLMFGLLAGLVMVGYLAALPGRLVPAGYRVGLTAGLTVVLAFGLTGLAWGLWPWLGGAWGQFTIVRVWLAVRGQLPWRLMAVLDDAHRRGVLRQAGAVYQFRHAELQRYLALGWYRKAAAAGDHAAEYNLGLLLQERGELAEAEGWLRKAAAAGQHDAEDILGLLLQQQGKLAEAEGWYRRAAAADDHIAEDNLGLLLQRQGKLAEAEGWYRRAAAAGNPLAERNLGALLQQRGELAEAEGWYRKAAAAAEGWYRRAATAGDHDTAYSVRALLHAAEYGLGRLLHQRAELAEAEGWLRKAAAEGWYWGAAHAGQHDAEFNLGALLEELGRVEEAERWYRKAADAGDEEAIGALARLLEERQR
jgi:TPR repeat protein